MSQQFQQLCHGTVFSGVSVIWLLNFMNRAQRLEGWNDLNRLRPYVNAVV